MAKSDEHIFHRTQSRPVLAGLAFVGGSGGHGLFSKESSPAALEEVGALSNRDAILDARVAEKLATAKRPRRPSASRTYGGVGTRTVLGGRHPGSDHADPPAPELPSHTTMVPVPGRKSSPHDVTMDQVASMGAKSAATGAARWLAATEPGDHHTHDIPSTAARRRGTSASATRVATGSSSRISASQPAASEGSARDSGLREGRGHTHGPSPVRRSDTTRLGAAHGLAARPVQAEAAAAPAAAPSSASHRSLPLTRAAPAPLHLEAPGIAPVAAAAMRHRTRPTRSPYAQALGVAPSPGAMVRHAQVQVGSTRISIAVPGRAPIGPAPLPDAAASSTSSASVTVATAAVHLTAMGPVRGPSGSLLSANASAVLGLPGYRPSGGQPAWSIDGDGTANRADGRNAARSGMSGPDAMLSHAPVICGPTVPMAATVLRRASAPFVAPAPQHLTGEEDTLEWPHRPIVAVPCVSAVGAVSWRGRNPQGTKINQDSVVVAEHAPSGSLLVGVFDGHGTNGRVVSQFMREAYPLALFGSSAFQDALAVVTHSLGSLGSDISTSTATTLATPRSGGASECGPARVHSTTIVDFLAVSQAQDAAAARHAHALAAAASPARSSTAGRHRAGLGSRAAGRGQPQVGLSAASLSASSSSTDGGRSPARQHSGRRSPQRGPHDGTAPAGFEVCCVMSTALLEVERCLFQSGAVDVSLSGTTGVLSLIHRGVVHTINVGDSRCNLVTSPYPLVMLSEAAIAEAGAASTPTGDPSPGVQPGAQLMQQLQALAQASPEAYAILNGLAPARGRSGSGRSRGSSGMARLEPVTITGSQHFNGPGLPVLASSAVTSSGLTVDHKPDDPSERSRIHAAGGRVAASKIAGAPLIAGPARVWLRTAQVPGLNMSRSLCDMVAKQAGVVSAPHMSVRRLGPLDRALVLGSDGIWDFVSAEEAGAVCLSTSNACVAAERLARIARARWLQRTAGADDTTALIVRLQLPQPFAAAAPALAVALPRPDANTAALYNCKTGVVTTAAR